MTSSYWIFIGVLAIAAFSIRITGLIAGNAIRKSRLAPLLDDLPGLIVVSLVAASMADQPAMTWIAATVALGIAWITNNVIVTMIVGVVAFAGLSLIGL